MTHYDSILSKLRSETGVLHTELEKTALSKALLEENVSMENYLLYLQKMRSVVDFYENCVFPVLIDTLADLPRRRRLEMIDHDLNRLSAKPIEQDVFNIQNAGGHPPVPYALGCMYVMEGSTLGGRIILKHIEKHLGLLPSGGASFFEGYGAETGQLWKSFLTTLQTYSLQNDADAAIVAGATDTFRSIKNHLES
ncbi:biliverdin-producing heme oxygenase [Emticicia fluvialis]|uniref:biliverdin-producing heme oxygenase n=1 Tax=Emticicia fluvialis TaxID=2974474 RepID=UPI0021659D1E|nr:biliverdin-producing heme oxygenase [Emticicia fluvialis]